MEKISREKIAAMVWRKYEVKMLVKQAGIGSALKGAWGAAKGGLSSVAEHGVAGVRRAGIGAADLAAANPAATAALAGGGIGAGVGALAGGEDNRLLGALGGAAAGAGIGYGVQGPIAQAILAKAKHISARAQMINVGKGAEQYSAMPSIAGLAR